MMDYTEAKKILKRDLNIMVENNSLPDGIEAMKTAIIALGAIEQIQWERDLAIEQLHGLGGELGEKTELIKHHIICNCCKSGQENIVGRRCQGCIEHNMFECVSQ